MAKKEAPLRVVSGVRDILLDEFNLTVKVDNNDNILKITRVGSTQDISRKTLPLEVYKALAQKLEQKI